MIEIAKVPNGTVVTQEMIAGWTSSISYEPGQVVLAMRPRAKLAIWFDRIRLMRWDVPDVIIEPFRASH